MVKRKHTIKPLYIKIGVVLIIVFMHTLFSLQLIDFGVYVNKIRGIETFQDLHNSKALSFSIFSDNQGSSPTSNMLMARANMHMRKTNDKFILGVGDHLNRAGNNEFLYFTCNDPFWRSNFYPTIADGENSLYGSSQSEWGAGRAFFDALNLNQRENVTFSKEGTDYYAIMKDPSGFNVHFISLYYPNKPAQPELAFRQTSKNFLFSVLMSINKKPNDIIVLAAHSRYGFFTEYLNPELRRLVNIKCDLIVSGSTHYYERQKTADMSKGPLIINAGSVTNPRFGSQPGFLQVCVLPYHQGIHIQYINLDQNTFEMKSSPYAYFKSFDGKVFDLIYDNQAI